MITRWMMVAALMAAGPAGCRAEPPAKQPDDPNAIAYGKGRRLCRLANRNIDESSGMACSRRNPGVFWTHNDSGSGPILYAFNKKGEDLGTFEIEGAKARDYEDIASFSLDGKHYLLVGDTGDNAERRKGYTLYLVEEPEVPQGKGRVAGKAKLLQTIDFTFEGGSRDGESLAVDPTSRTIFVATRTYSRKCEIFQLPLPTEPPKRSLVAKHIATAKIKVGNAMDISPDGLRAVISSYWDGYEFTRKPGEDWATAFRRTPRVIALPGRKERRKGESVAYGPDGKTLYLTSEGSACPLWEVPVEAPK